MTTPEEKTREVIDRLLESAGWRIQNLDELNLGAALGVSVREFPLKTGEADYLLFVDRKAVGVIEAKHVGDTLSGVAEQTAKYVGGIPNNLPHIHEPLPFAYESTGIETIFRDNRDPETCSKPIFAFHKPEHLLYLGNQEYTLLTLLCILYVSHTADFGNWQMSSSTMIEYTKN